MRLITISGLDGSGKSTQIELLKTYLEDQGKKVFYLHAIQFGLANKLSGQKLSGQSKGIVKANVFQIALRKIFLQIDLWRFGRLWKKLEAEGYAFILSDRYFYDSLINIAFLSGDSPAPADKILKPKVAIYLQIGPETIMQRERQPDQGLEYLRKKKELYDQAAKNWNLQVIDGNRNKEEIFENIKNLVTSN